MRKFLSKINRDLLPMKGHYFLYNAGTVPVVPYLSTYARQLGLSSAVVGVIYTFLPISGMIAKPVLGAIADRFHCHKGLFLGSMLLTAAAFLGIFYSPEIPISNNNVHFSCDDGGTVFDTSISNVNISQCSITNLQTQDTTTNCNMNCIMTNDYWNIVESSWHIPVSANHSDNFKFTAIVDVGKSDMPNGQIAYFWVKEVGYDNQNYKPICSKGDVDHISTSCTIKCDDFDFNSMFVTGLSDSEAYGLWEFWCFLVLMILGWVGQAIVVSIGDAICFEMLGDEPTKYGYQRMYGALGWGIFGIITGLIVDAMSQGSTKKNFIVAFYLSCAFLIFDFICCFQLKYKQRKMSTNILHDIGKLLLNIRIVIFLFWCIGVGMCTALMWNFLFYLIEDLAKNGGCDGDAWIKTLEGIVMAVQTLAGEMPFFFWSGAILKRIGHTNAMSLVLLVIGVRYILYSVISNPWWFLSIDVLNGLTFGLFYACMASYASIVAPPGTEATMQGMVGAIFEGVGVSLGSYIGGQLYDVYGGPLTFRMFGIGALIASVLHFGVQYLLNRSGSETKENKVRYASPLKALTLAEDQQELTLREPLR